MSERPCSPPDLQETPSPPLLASGSPSCSLVDGGLSPVFTVGIPASISASSPLFMCLWVHISPLIKGLQSSGPQPVPVTSPTPLPLQRAHLQVRPHPQGRGSGPQRTWLETQGNSSVGLGEISTRLQGHTASQCGSWVYSSRRLTATLLRELLGGFGCSRRDGSACFQASLVSKGPLWGGDIHREQQCVAGSSPELGTEDFPELGAESPHGAQPGIVCAR